jgi:hypothetical protein
MPLGPHSCKHGAASGSSITGVGLDKALDTSIAAEIRQDTAAARMSGGMDARGPIGPMSRSIFRGAMHSTGLVASLTMALSTVPEHTTAVGPQVSTTLMVALHNMVPAVK